MDHLSKQCKQTTRRDNRDLSSQRLSDPGSPPLLRAAIRVSLPWVKVAPGQQVFQVQVSLRFAPLHHNHGVGLSEQGPSCSKLSQLYQLDNNLARG